MYGAGGEVRRSAIDGAGEIRGNPRRVKMPRIDKKLMVSELKDSLRKCEAVLVVGYSGLSSNDINKLRQSLCEANGTMRIVKNRLARIVVEKKRAQLVPYIDGPTAFVTSSGEVVNVVKALVRFAGSHKQFQLKGALIGSVIIGEEEIKSFAMLPGRDQMLAQLFGSMISPISGFLNVVMGPIGAFIRTLNAIRVGKE